MAKPMSFAFAVCFFLGLSFGPNITAHADEKKVPSAPTAPDTKASSPEQQKEICLETINLTVRESERARLKGFCDRISELDACQSVEGRPIPHVDFSSSDKDAKRILVFGMIHGDEPLAGEMAVDWAQRLEDLHQKKVEPRNSWRVVPLLNPDGLRRKTRMNAHGVDLNRNFPTKDWDDQAVKFWKKTGASDARRFPGGDAASENETKCAIQQIKDFKPDFIVSVHTPYHTLDFDGPKMPFPHYKDLPWRALGNFPGSLGRYMWRDHQTPVLTVELGLSMIDSAQLQDVVGTFAIEAAKRSGRATASTFDQM